MAQPKYPENDLQENQDERLREVSFLSRQLNKPELGAISGAVLVFVFFGFTAGGTGMFAPDGIMNWSTVSAQLGLIAIGACLLMIAGEFDLSIGSMIGFAGIMIAVPSVYWDWPVWLSILFAFAGAVSIGFINGYIVILLKNKMTGWHHFLVGKLSKGFSNGLEIMAGWRHLPMVLLWSMVFQQSFCGFWVWHLYASGCC
jgi:hypothetical protein